MSDYFDSVKSELLHQQSIWLVTGVAGFIGSNLLETLLTLDQKVVGLDNFSTGNAKNLDLVKSSVGPKRWSNFSFMDGDIRNQEACQAACEGVDFVLHQAALGSVPRSIDDPVTTNQVNVGGFLNMLVSARDAEVNRFVYAASSSTYGDHPDLPKVEDRIGKPLSPYSVTKLVNELYADVFGNIYGLNSVGLRYFNVFGPRQDPQGAYAAVMPKWLEKMVNEEPLYINGDGETSRDFCFVENVVQANILAAVVPTAVQFPVYNIACGEQTSLIQLFTLLRDQLAMNGVEYPHQPIYRDFRSGDVQHSLADIARAKTCLHYEPTRLIAEGIEKYVSNFVSKD